MELQNEISWKQLSGYCKPSHVYLPYHKYWSELWLISVQDGYQKNHCNNLISCKIVMYS